MIIQQTDKQILYIEDQQKVRIILKMFKLKVLKATEKSFNKLDEEKQTPSPALQAVSFSFL